jgi:O-antigen ligase
MILKNIVLGLMAVLVFLVPWGSGAIDFGVAGFGAMSLAGILAFLAAVAYLFFGQRGLGQARIPMDASIVLFGVFVAWNLASVGWAENAVSALSSSISYIQLFVLAWLLLFLRLHRRGFETLLHAYVLGCGLMLVLLAPDVLAHAAGSATIKRLDGFGMTANRFAYTLILGIPMAFYLAQKLRSAPLRWLYLLYIPGAILVVILSGSRGMFVALLVAGFALLWLLLKGEPIGKARVSRTRLFVSLGILAGLLAVLSASYGHVVESQLERILTITDAVESDVGGRWNIWVAGFGVFLDNLWIGVGSGHFSRAIIPFFEGDVFIFSFLGAGAAAHNTFLAIAVETGTIGLLIFGAMLFALMRNMRGIGRKEQALFFSLFAVSLTAALTLSLESVRLFYLALFLPLAYASTYPQVLETRTPPRASMLPKPYASLTPRVLPPPPTTPARTHRAAHDPR